MGDSTKEVRPAHYLLGTIVAPLATAREVAEQRPVVPAALIVLVTSVLTALTMRLAHHYAADGVFYLFSLPGIRVVRLAVLTPPWPVMVILVALFSLAGWIVRTGVLQVVAELCGGTGRAFSLLSALGYAVLPLALLLPTLWICVAAGGGQLETGAAAGAWYVISAVIFIWTAALVLVALQEVHRLSLGRTFAVVIAVAAAAVLLGFVWRLAFWMSHAA